MINVNDIPRISELLSACFFQGFSIGYCASAIEEKIILAPEFDALERGDASFLNRVALDHLVEHVFSLEFAKQDAIKTNAISLWLGELYTRIFFRFGKSFSFIFLYLPLDKAISMFSVYHEMGFSRALSRFEDGTKKATILRLLLKKKKMAAWELSQLSCVRYNTIVRFTRHNEHLYNAGFAPIFKISQILGVKVNIFAEYIANCTNSGMYDFDKTNPRYRSYLGLLFSEYFFVSLAVRKYLYDEEENAFHSGDSILKITWTSIASSPKESMDANPEIESIVKEYALPLSEAKRKDHILMIFEYNRISLEPEPYHHLLDEYGLEAIILINERHLLFIGPKCSKERITDRVHNALINNAKRMMGGDFAV